MILETKINNELELSFDDITLYYEFLTQILNYIRLSNNDKIKSAYETLFFDLISFYASLDKKTKHMICFLLLDDKTIDDNDKDNLYHLFSINIDL